MAQKLSIEVVMVRLQKGNQLNQASLNKGPCSLGRKIMSMITSLATSDNWDLLDTQKLEESEKVCAEFHLPLKDRFILVNIDTQRLHLLASKLLIDSYPISTALNGVGQKEGTGKTPLGLHFVAEKIGSQSDPFEIFKARKATGEIAKADEGEKLIVGRILWLQGVQPGFNQGNDLEGGLVDSRARYIYIHGTNDVANIGKPVSAGCVRMNPIDVVDLFEKVSERTPVYIYKND